MQTVQLSNCIARKNVKPKLSLPGDVHWECPAFHVTGPAGLGLFPAGEAPNSTIASRARWCATAYSQRAHPFYVRRSSSPAGADIGHYKSIAICESSLRAPSTVSCAVDLHTRVIAILRI